MSTVCWTSFYEWRDKREKHWAHLKRQTHIHFRHFELQINENDSWQIISDIHYCHIRHFICCMKIECLFVAQDTMRIPTKRNCEQEIKSTFESSSTRAFGVKHIVARIEQKGDKRTTERKKNINEGEMWDQCCAIDAILFVTALIHSLKQEGFESDFSLLFFHPAFSMYGSVQN